LQNTETAREATAYAKVVNISDYKGRKEEKARVKQKKIQSADKKFAALGETGQRKVLCYMIGYMEASKDLLTSGKPGRGNEVSTIFQEMEELINESWKENLLAKKKGV
jgi:hypothetical protein